MFDQMSVTLLGGQITGMRTSFRTLSRIKILQIFQAVSYQTLLGVLKLWQTSGRPYGPGSRSR